MGDSLTAGTVSADWVAALAGAAPGWAAVNAGVNGQVRKWLFTYLYFLDKQTCLVAIICCQPL